MKRTFSLTLGIMLALSLLLSACNTGPKIDECIVGIWQINDADAFARAVLPEGAAPPDSFTFVRGNEEMAYKFNDNGVIQVLGVEWRAFYNIDVEGDAMLMDMIINGFVFGEYQIVDDKRVMVTYVSEPQQAIQYQAAIGGELLADTNQAVQFLPLFVHPANIADVTCTEDTLSLTILNRSDLEAPITFTRQVEEPTPEPE
jgi:hypothetical protein